MPITLRQLSSIWGEPYNRNHSNLNVPIGTITTDSRKLTKGSFFVPLLGENHDGHFYINEAYKRGAQATIVSEKCTLPIPDNLTYWRVKDTLMAFQELALLHRRSLVSPVIAITGSVGKTTTRELVHSALRSLGPILSTSGNNNNDVGVPLTLLRADFNHVAIVIEMGMRGLGEIERLSKCASPDIAIITNIGSSHISRLGTREKIAQAKAEITSFLNPDGVLIIPAGDSVLENAVGLRWKGRIIRVDLHVNTDERQVNQDKNIDLIGSLNLNDWSISFQDNKFKLPLEGVHNARNFMLSLAVASEVKVPLESIGDFPLELPAGRGQMFKIGGINVMDQTYNSSPESVMAAVDLLATKPGRRFAVLGNMLELGIKSVDLHREVIDYALKKGLDGLVIFVKGPEAEVMQEAANSLKYVEVASSPEEAFFILKNWLRSGDFLLLKASRQVALERLLPLLKDHY